MTLVTNIISSIGNNNSIAPLIIRDCGIEVPTKILMTYNQNKSNKDIAYLAARERFVDEYAVSAVWLGGVPLMGFIADKLIKKINKFNPNINSKLLKEEEFQGLKYNINKFKEKAPEAVADLEKIAKNTSKYKRNLAGKFLLQTIIPIALIGWIIPKAVFAWTAKTKEKQAKAKQNNTDTFTKSSIENKKTNPNFKGGIGSLADLSNLEKLFITDAGYAVGRIATARKRNEAYDIGVKMSGMIYLNYIFPKQLEKLLNGISSNLLKTNLDLDIKLLNNKEFLDAIKNQALELPQTDSAKDLIEFIDNKPDSLFTKYANEFGKIKMLDNKTRDPRAYVDFKQLGEFRNSIENFIKTSTKSGLSEDKILEFAKKAKKVKTFNTLFNISVSSILLAFGLPKFQFMMREIITGSKLEPGIID